MTANIWVQTFLIMKQKKVMISKALRVIFFLTFALFTISYFIHDTLVLYEVILWLFFHITVWVEIVESFSSGCLPFKSTRDPTENNFHPQHQRFLCVFMYVHYRNQIYHSSLHFFMACVKSKREVFLFELTIGRQAICNLLKSKCLKCFYETVM